MSAVDHRRRVLALGHRMLNLTRHEQLSKDVEVELVELMVDLYLELDATVNELQRLEAAR